MHPQHFYPTHSRTLLAFSMMILCAFLAPKQAHAQDMTRARGMAEDALVAIEGSGVHAGFLVHERYVAAAAHCMEHEAREGLRVRFQDGNDVQGRVVALRADLDLALVQIPGGHGHDPLPMASRGDDIAPGGLVAHAGHPQGLEWVFTLGNFAGTSTSTSGQVQLRFAGSVHPGDSGGPLVCEAGQVHGVVVAGARDRPEGYAVPIEHVRDMLQRVQTATAPRVRRSTPTTTAQNPLRVTVYGATWCGACQSALAWLREQGISHEERDAAELGEVRSIPVIVVQGPRGRVSINGFSPAAVTQAITQVR